MQYAISRKDLTSSRRNNFEQGLSRKKMKSMDGIDVPTLALEHIFRSQSDSNSLKNDLFYYYNEL